jgi:hypothetical protein
VEFYDCTNLEVMSVCWPWERWRRFIRHCVLYKILLCIFESIRIFLKHIFTCFCSMIQKKSYVWYFVFIFCQIDLLKRVLLESSKKIIKSNDLCVNVVVMMATKYSASFAKKITWNGEENSEIRYVMWHLSSFIRMITLLKRELGSRILI